MERPTRGVPRYGSSGLLVGAKHASLWGLAWVLPGEWSTLGPREQRREGTDLLQVVRSDSRGPPKEERGRVGIRLR
jgi:hypothetical protein